MDIHDLDSCALLIVVRRDDKRQIKPDTKRDDGQDQKRQHDLVEQREKARRVGQVSHLERFGFGLCHPVSRGLVTCRKSFCTLMVSAWTPGRFGFLDKYHEMEQVRITIL